MSALLPVSLDLSRLSVALVGGGPRAERRLGLLDEAGAARLKVFSAQPTTALSARAGDRLRRRLPAAEDFRGVNVVFVAELKPDAAHEVAQLARAAGALVNVEDVTGACDFHSAAVVRRGDLALGISTSGRCPMLARVLKQWLERLLPKDFGRTLDALAEERRRLRAEGAGAPPLEAAVLGATAPFVSLSHGASPHRADDAT
ncbi:MAG: precorrin-2 dehydrogenase/sirohydrochlorin ferrochelatase family protein [Rhodospirillales bacterium]